MEKALSLKVSRTSHKMVVSLGFGIPFPTKGKLPFITKHIFACFVIIIKILQL
jgi:hypothetical protein